MNYDFPLLSWHLREPIEFLAKLVAKYSSNSAERKLIFAFLVAGSDPCYQLGLVAGGTMCQHSKARHLLTPQPLIFVLPLQPPVVYR